MDFFYFDGLDVEEFLISPIRGMSHWVRFCSINSSCTSLIIKEALAERIKRLGFDAQGLEFPPEGRKHFLDGGRSCRWLVITVNVPLSSLH